MTIFYIPNPTQYLNLITTLLTINLAANYEFIEVIINGLLSARIWP